MVSNICGYQYINFYGLKKMNLTSWTLADQDYFPCMSGRIYVGNTCYPIRYICDILHKKILFKLNQRLFPGEAIFGRLSEILLF